MMSNIQRIERRKFFCSAAALAIWTLWCDARARGDEDARTIGLGFSLYGMKSLSTSAALTALKEIGYDCVELPVMPDWHGDSAKLTPAARRDLRAELAIRGLRLTSLMENLPALGSDDQHAANLERLKRAAEVAHDLTPDQGAVPLIETILGGKAGEFDAVKDRLVERLTDWSKVLADAKVLLAIKAHVGNATQRPDQLIWLLDQIASPWLKAAYDYSHFQAQGLDLKATLKTLIPRSVFIHVKDIERMGEKFGFVLPGEGTIDYGQMFQQIRQASYRGDVMVEVSSQVSSKAGYDPLAAARKCYNHLAEAFSKAGLKRG
jgi:sugar phosphate isomerase/epimerase